MLIGVTVNVNRADSFKISMNLKSFGAVSLLLLTLSAGVEKSESAVSTRLLLFYALGYF